jgi:YD repeat-containing protein
MALSPIRRLLVARRALTIVLALSAVTASASNVIYTVDPASGRVITATFPDQSSITYTYDANGNRTGAQVTLAQDTVPPTAPGTPAFSGITATSATATWTDATDNRPGITYEWSRNGGSTWTSVGGALSASITGLTGSTNYTVLVRARDAANNAGPTSSGSFMTSDVTPPSAPGTPAFSNITATSATATWSQATDNVGVLSYEWSRNGGSTWTSVGGALSASLTGLSGSTNYTVLVRARDAANNVGPTSQNSFSTPDVTPPSAPGTPDFSAITATSATASWSAASDNVAVTGYEWSRNGGSTWTSVGTTQSANITGLTGSTSYTILVRARDAATNVGPNSSNSFTTSPAVDSSAPTAPGTPSFNTITATSANATWATASDNVGVTGYEYSLNGGAWTATGSASPGVGLSSLTSGVSYTFAVRARDAANNVGPSTSNTFSTLDNVSPSAPGTPGFNSITATSASASWGAASDNVAVTGYEYSLNGGSWTSTGGSTSVGLTGLSQATSYTLQVRARDAASNLGPPSSNSFSTPDVSAPSAPGTPVFSAITGSSATADWGAATDNVAVVEYQYSLNGGTWTSTGASRSVGLSGLSQATSYTLQVRARDAANNIGSPSSNSFTTPDVSAPSAPGTPGFSSITANSATASWGAASDNVAVTGYEYSLSGGAWTSTGGSTSVGLTGLSQATGYSFQVRARDAANNIGPPSANSFSTPDVTPPGAPGTPNFTLITGSSATASWGAASDNVAVTGYEYSLSGGAWTSTGGSTSVGLTGLSQATGYSFQVRARDAANLAGPPSSNSFTTLDVTAPSAPGALSFSSIGSTTAVVSWGAASDNVGVARYESSVNGGGWVNVGSGTSTTLSGLSPGASNSVAIRAVDGASNAGNPSSGSVTTLAQVTISNRSISTTAARIPGGAAVYQIRSTGDIWASGTTTTVGDVGDWLVPKTGMAGFEVRALPVSGACTSGTFTTWLSPSNEPSWSVGRGGTAGVSSCTIDVEIRHSGNPSVILGTARIFLTMTTT